MLYACGFGLFSVIGKSPDVDYRANMPKCHFTGTVSSVFLSSSQNGAIVGM